MCLLPTRGFWFRFWGSACEFFKMPMGAYCRSVSLWHMYGTRDDEKMAGNTMLGVNHKVKD